MNLVPRNAMTTFFIVNGELRFIPSPMGDILQLVPMSKMTTSYNLKIEIE